MKYAVLAVLVVQLFTTAVLVAYVVVVRRQPVVVHTIVEHVADEDRTVDADEDEDNGIYDGLNAI